MENNKPHIERLLKAFSLQEPNRVPNFETGIENRNISAILGENISPCVPIEPIEHVEVARRIGSFLTGYR